LNRLQIRINKLEKKAGVGRMKVILLIDPSPEELEMAEQKNKDQNTLLIVRFIVRPGDPL
jgi:ubiquinone/menaquinone biosynthesis C-methylase UbiE